MRVRIKYTLTFEKDIEVDSNNMYEAEEQAADEIYKNKENHVDGEVIEADNIALKWAVE